MTRYEELLAQLEAAEAALRERHGERITRITVSPTVTPWLKRKIPAADPAKVAPWPGLLGIPLVEDPRFLPGQVRIHRGEAFEDWFAVPVDEPEQLIQFGEPEFPFPWSPR